MWNLVPENVYEFKDFESYEIACRHFPEMPALTDKAKKIIWTIRAKHFLSETPIYVTQNASDKRIVILCEDNNKIKFAYQDLPEDLPEATRLSYDSNGGKKDENGNLPSDYYWEVYVPKIEEGKEGNISYVPADPPIQKLTLHKDATSAISRSSCVSEYGHIAEVMGKGWFAAIIFVGAFFHFIQSSNYHQGIVWGGPEGFMGADDPLVGVLWLLGGITLARNAYYTSEAENPVGNIYLKGDEYLNVKNTAQKNIHSFWCLMCVLGMYGVIRLAIGACLGEDNFAMKLSSMGDVYTGESKDLGKTLTMAFIYGGLAVGAGYKAYKGLRTTPQHGQLNQMGLKL